ncbi:MAG: ABC transporter ATP-binding protein/permease [Lachnospiraceae bacterium]|nr:ABC transporter ATP-binding protein/permease [Lachnospiraceae bacterium]
MKNNKIIPVIKVLFPTAAKRFPLFFPLEALKTVIEIIRPFIAIFMTPLIVDELINDRRVEKLVLYAGILVVGEFLVSVIADRLSQTLQKYQERLDNYFTMQIGLHSMELDFQLTEDKAALDQLDKAKTGMTWYSGGAYGIAEQVFSFFGNAFKLLGMVTIISIHAPLLLLLIVLYVVIMAWITSKRNKIELEAYGKLAKINRLFGYFGWEIVDFRYGKDIRLYDAQDLMVSHWEKNTVESNAAWKWEADKGFPLANLGDISALLRSLLTYAYTGFLAIKGVFSIGIFTQMVEAADGMNSTLGGLVWNILELMKRCNYAYEYVLFMEYPAALTKGDVPVPEGLHEIEFRNVSFAYPGTERKVLDNVSIKINAGERLSVVGLNGAGKTTFIKLLCRLYDPDSGEILLDGRDIREYDYKQYMEQFAPVFQDFKLFAFSIRENITLTDSEDSADTTNTADALDKTDIADTSKDSDNSGRDSSGLEDLYKMVEIDSFVNKLEKKDETKLFKFFDEEGVEPSGGEQQKIAIARALRKNSPVVILDEPTAALDPVAEYDIYREFNTLVGNKTAVYISHRLSSCRFCDRIAVFRDGRIAEYGTHDELARITGGIYAAMYEAQAKYYR